MDRVQGTGAGTGQADMGTGGGGGGGCKYEHTHAQVGRQAATTCVARHLRVQVGRDRRRDPGVGGRSRRVEAWTRRRSGGGDGHEHRAGRHGRRQVANVSTRIE